MRRLLVTGVLAAAVLGVAKRTLSHPRSRREETIRP